MKHLFRLGIVLGLFLLLAGCNSNAITKFESFKDPAFAGITLQKTLIIAEDSKFARELFIEQSFATKFLKYTIPGFIPAPEIFYPTRNYSELEKKSIIKENQIQAILEVSLSDYHTEKEYVPGIATKSGHAHQHGDNIVYDEITIKNQGRYLPKPLVTFKLKIIEAATGKNIWIATAWTAGSVYATFENLIDSLTDETIKQLAKDGLVALPKKP